jgi:cytochrome P450
MALLTVLLTLLALPAALFVWTAKSLADNTAKAKATGLPYLVRWVSPINPFWLLWGSSFVRLCKRWGVATENLKRIYSYGWEANERANIHVDNGDVLMVVHPGGIQLCVANADLIYEILRRRTDFRRNMEEMSVLNVYGKNLSTTDDGEWQRHRKMTAITFTEKNNELVWQQSLSQTNGMLEFWTQRAEQPVRTTHLDTKVFTLNVLAAAIFNKVYPFEGQAEEKLEKHAGDTSYTYRESLNTILGSIIQIFIFGEEGLKSRWLPKSWNRAADAMATFRSYIFGLMEEERVHIAEGKIDNRHLVARLVAAQQEEEDAPSGKANGAEKPGKRMNMTEQEILSNLFVYAFAGNDTTAISLTNLLAQLAANPETQEWMAEEINHYLPKDGSEPTYDTFPKLKRCGAVIVSKHFRHLLSSRNVLT